MGTEHREFHFLPEESDFVIFRLPGGVGGGRRAGRGLEGKTGSARPSVPGQQARPAGRLTGEKGAVIPNEDGDWEALRMLFLEPRRSVITWASLCPWEGPVKPRGWPETSSSTRKDILADIPGET